MPRFTLKSLLLSTAFFAGAAGAITICASPVTADNAIRHCIAWFASGGFIGAGIGALYGRPGRGAILGLFVMLLASMFLIPSVNY